MSLNKKKKKKKKNQRNPRRNPRRKKNKNSRKTKRKKKMNPRKKKRKNRSTALKVRKALKAFLQAIFRSPIRRKSERCASFWSPHSPASWEKRLRCSSLRSCRRPRLRCRLVFESPTEPKSTRTENPPSLSSCFRFMFVEAEKCRWRWLRNS